MTVTHARVMGSVRAQGRVLGRRDCDLDCRTEALRESLNRWLAIVCTIPNKHLDRASYLIEQAGKGSWVANVIRGQIGADDLATNKIKTKVQLAPRASFALGFMLFLKPFLTRQAHAQRAAERAPSPKIFSPVLSTTSCTGLALWVTALADRLSPLPLRDMVVKCGTVILTPISLAMERIKPCVCRNACLNTMRSIKHISIAKSE